MFGSTAWTHNFSSEAPAPGSYYYNHRRSHYYNDVYYNRTSDGMKVMSAPSFEPRNAPDGSLRGMDAHNYHRNGTKYETTAEGDVVIVEPSFDAEDSDDRGPSGEHFRSAEGRGGGPNGRRSHSRNLSEHFFDATTLSVQQEDETSRHESDSRYGAPRGYRGPPPTMSPAIGKKHRRVFSGDVTNPREAHRRINSVGKSANIQRRSYGQERQHQRVDSLGLDVLTAAADVSREELAAAAGASERPKGARNPWEPPASRRSPVEMISYDHSAGGIPPPPPPPRGQHHSYPSSGAPPTSGYYANGLPYPQHPYAPSYYHPGHGYHAGAPTPPPSGYPVQYARGQDPYAKHPVPGQPKSESADNGPIIDSYNHKDPNESPTGRDGSAMTPPPPVHPGHWRNGATQGSQTYVTTIGGGEGGRKMHPPPRYPGSEGAEQAYHANHHRKTSSVISWVPSSIYSGNQNDTSDHPLKGGHHRATSSSVSFLQCFDVGLDNQDAAFLQNLQASAASPSKPFGGPQVKPEVHSSTSDTNNDSGGDTEDADCKLAPGGTSKRVRRKCTVPDCTNRVVQGGLCISHGAKRKTCKHPGCTKNVKKAGLCSTHGPARKRCDADGCTKVAVQGGKCIAHGAKKKLCSVENCTKQAILGGMCKKHHDHNRNVNGGPGSISETNSNDNDADSPIGKKPVHKPTHTRGLSIFQEISADAVGSLLSGNEAEAASEPPPPTGHRHQSTFSRDFGSLY